MKSFKQYITERPARLTVGQLSRRSIPRDTRGLINPSESELSSYTKNTEYNQVRILVDKKGKLYAWDADDALHQEIISGEGLNKDDVMLGSINHGSVYDGWVIQLSPEGGRNKYAKKNKVLAALMKDKDNEVEAY